MTGEITIHVFACGQGDTILLSLRGKWVLIDCNLPEGEIRETFFDKIRALDIRRLDVLCLTHPHEDHYHGMEQVVDYFTTDGRTLGMFCHSGLNPHVVIKIIKEARRSTPARINEYDRLSTKLSKLFQARTVAEFRAYREGRPILRNGPDLYLVPVGPNARTVDDITLRAAGKADWNSWLRKSVNRLSVVLALCVRTDKREVSLDALLAADTDGEGFEDACKSLEEYHDDGARCGFDLVKIRHHGSLDSHQGSSICGRAKADCGNRLAVVCCNGESRKLPDRVVMRAFLDAGWKVLPTARRLRAPSANSRSYSALTMVGSRLPGKAG